LPHVEPSVLDAQLGSLMLVLGDTAAAVQDAAAATGDAADKQDNGILEPLVFVLDATLQQIKAQLDRANVPYSYGWSIVLLTAVVKTLTFPLTKKQVESALAVQELRPQLEALKARYGADKDRIQKETSLLYEEAGVNPLAGCLPSLATIPIFIGLYRSLSNVASDGLLDAQGFYWIPTLAGPTTVAANKAGAGTDWLLPFVDGAPPIGWDGAWPYLVFPVALVAMQYLSMAIMNPPVDETQEGAKTQQLILKALPLMIGWFSLNVPSGLSLYYFSNSVFTMAQQIYLKKLGGAEIFVNPVSQPGTARRTGESVDDAEVARLLDDGAAASTSSAATAAPPLVGADDSKVAAAVAFDGGDSPVMAASSNGEGIAAAAAALAAAEPVFDRRCKRKRKVVPAAEPEVFDPAQLGA
jgi:YidC/Oxa1 family membrane protein insertase